MCRISDSWVNATQILRAASAATEGNLQRLVNELGPGQFERVRGDEDYQGIWVDWDIAKELIGACGLDDEILLSLVAVDPGKSAAARQKEGQSRRTDRTDDDGDTSGEESKFP